MRAFCAQPTPSSIARHTQVSREPPSILSLLSVWRSIYRTPNRVSLSSEVAKRIIFEGTSDGCKCEKTPRGGRQGTLFDLPDAQAIYAITIGTRGHKTHKVGQVTNWVKS